MQIFKAGVLYFALVFGAGFLFGTVRILLVEPQFGVRMAELMEAPFMLVITIVAAKWVVRRLSLSSTLFSRLGMGFIALSLLLVVEFVFVLRLRGLSISEYFATRDVISGTVYYIMLVVFAIMPLFVSRK